MGRPATLLSKHAQLSFARDAADEPGYVEDHREGSDSAEPETAVDEGTSSNRLSTQYLHRRPLRDTKS